MPKESIFAITLLGKPFAFETANPDEIKDEFGRNVEKFRRLSEKANACSNAFSWNINAELAFVDDVRSHALEFIRSANPSTIGRWSIVPHFHGTLVINQGSIDEVRKLLSDAFPGARQVMIKPLFDKQGKSEAIQKWVKYTFKSDTTFSNRGNESYPGSADQMNHLEFAIKVFASASAKFWNRSYHFALKWLKRIKFNEHFKKISRMMSNTASVAIDLGRNVIEKCGEKSHDDGLNRFRKNGKKCNENIGIRGFKVDGRGVSHYYTPVREPDNYLDELFMSDPPVIMEKRHKVASRKPVKPPIGRCFVDDPGLIPAT